MSTAKINIASNIDYDQPDRKSALEAMHEAQKIAFGPIVFQATVAMRDLKILETIARHHEGGVTAREIADTLDLSLYGVKVLLEVGLSSEIVRLVEEDRYVLTKTGYVLLKDKLTGINLSFVNDVCYEGMLHLKESITGGYPAGLKKWSDSDTIYPALTSLPLQVQESWFAFDQFYSDAAFPQALRILFDNDRPRHILDIGGNTGKWAIQCARYNKNVQITVVDLPPQLEEAGQNARKHGLDDRIHLAACDLLDSSAALPTGFDVIWMSQFLDCFSEEQITDILHRVKSAMSENTRLLIMELFWDRQQFDTATFSLHNTSLYFTCLANGNSKIYHSREFMRCIDRAGLRVVRDIDNIGISHTLLECRL